MTSSVFGSTGTTVLFAIMVSGAAIVLISILFISSKYMARAYFGIYDPVVNPNMPHYSLLTNPTAFERDNQPYVNYNGETYFLDVSIRSASLARRINKVDVLSNDQLEELFPFQSYKDWNNGGKEDVKVRNKGILGYIDEFQEEEAGEEEGEAEHQVQVNPNQTNTTVTSEQDLSDLKPSIEVNIEMNEIPITTIPHFDSGICAICLDDLVDEDIVRGLICGHVFHKDCIDPWLTQRKGVCPTCKKDFYLISNGHEIDEDGEQEVLPGSLELDEILNVSHSNPYAFFLITCITEFKAMVLLSALELVRLGVYNNDNNDDDSIDNDERVIQVDRRLKQFEQPLIKEDEVPPRPDLKHFNKQINNLLKTTPRPFNESDLHEIDKLAMNKANFLSKGITGYYLKWMNISWDDIYFLNVIKFYESNRSKRLNNDHQ